MFPENQDGKIFEGSGEDLTLEVRLQSHGLWLSGKDLFFKNAILACVKHFALYRGRTGIGRDYNTVDMSHIRMFNEYFPPYKAAVDAYRFCNGIL